MGLLDALKNLPKVFRRGAGDAADLPAAKRARVGEMFTAGPRQIGEAMRGTLDGDQNSYLDLCAIFHRFYLTDGHLGGEIDKFIREVSKWPWNIAAADDDPKGEEIAAAATTFLREIPRFRAGVLEELAWAYVYGRAVVEWGGVFENGAWRITRAKGRPVWAMRKSAAGSWETQDENGNWTPVTPGKVLAYENELHGDATTAGLMWQIVWLLLFKNYTLKDWMAFLEVYGVPLRVGKVPEGYRPGSAEWETVARAVLNAASDSGAVINKDMEIQFVEAMKGQTIDAFEKSARFWDAAVSKRLLGGTLTSDAGKRGEGAQSLGEVQQDEKHEITKPRAEDLAVFIDQNLVRLFVLAHYGERPAWPRFAFSIVRIDDLNKETATVFGFIDRGLPVDVNAVYDRYMSWARPNEGDPVLVVTRAPDAAPNSDAAPDAAPKMFALRAGLVGGVETFTPNFFDRFDGNLALAARPEMGPGDNADDPFIALNRFAEHAAGIARPIVDQYVDELLIGLRKDGALDLGMDDAGKSFRADFTRLLAPSLSVAITCAIAHVAREAAADGVPLDLRAAVRGVAARLGKIGDTRFTGNLPLAGVPEFPNVITLASAGADGVDASNWHGVTPEKALEFWRTRMGVPASEYVELDEAARAAAFTIAGVQSQRVVDAAKQAIDSALADGITETEFRRRVRAALVEGGDKPLSDERLAFVWKQNLATAYGAGRRATQIDPSVKALMPWGEWISQLVGPTRRKHHVQLHGVTLPIDDPFFQSYYPPQGFGCECRVAARPRVRTGNPTQVPGGIEAKMAESGFTNPIAQWERTVRGEDLPVGDRPKPPASTTKPAPKPVAPALLKPVAAPPEIVESVRAELAELGIETDLTGLSAPAVDAVRTASVEAAKAGMTLPVRVESHDGLIPHATDRGRWAWARALPLPSQRVIVISNLVDGIADSPRGVYADASVLGAVRHEIAHLDVVRRALDAQGDRRRPPGGPSWFVWLRSAWPAAEADWIARHVSRAASRNPAEFLCEVYAGLRAGRAFPAEIMAIYDTLPAPRWRPGGAS